jgi:hypothetical protein
MENSTIFVKNSIAIDCQDVCSLSFLSLALLDEKRDSILFFSSQNYLLVKSELNHLKIHSKIYHDYQERVTFHFLRQAISSFESDFFIEFEEKIRNFDGSLVYFDRIDYFLDFNAYEKYEETVKKLKEITEKYNKKIIYIYNTKSSQHTYLDRALKKYAYIFDFMNKNDKEVTMPALWALQDELLDDKSIANKKAFIGENNSKIQVMLMSDSDALKKLHYYIFSSASDVDYYTIDKLPDEEMDLIYEMDIIIYNKKDASLKKKILESIKKEKLDLKFFEITNQAYLRQKDLLLANIDGVDKLFKKDFLMEDFVMSIEMYLKSSFYSRRLLSLEESEIVMHKKELFEKKIADLLEKKIFFSLLRYQYDADADIESYNIQKIVREYDNIFVNKRKKEITFLVLNTIPDFAAQLIQERIENFSITLELSESKSSFDLIFD